MMNRILNRRHFTIAAGAFVAAMPLGASRAGEIKSGPDLTVIELFTSEGCWSCPPAEERLAEIADRPDILALAYHVDYWDYIGWEDPFADPEFTRRQRQYARFFDSRTVYTPQMVFQGSSHAPGSRSGELENQLRRVAKLERVGVEIRQESSGVMTATLPDVPGAPLAQVIMVYYDHAQTSDVLRGENAGKTLTHRNVVRGMVPLGEWRGGATAFDIIGPTERTSNRMGCAILVQALDSGRILGAGAFDLPADTAG